MVTLGERLKHLGQEILVHELGGADYPAHLATVADAADRISALELALREIAEGHIDSGGTRRNHFRATSIAREVLGIADL